MTSIAELVSESIYAHPGVADVAILYDDSVSVTMEDDTKFSLTIEEVI